MTTNENLFIPLIKSNFTFNTVELIPGVYLTESNTLGIKLPTKEKRNAGLLIHLNKIPKIKFKSGHPDLDVVLFGVISYLYLKTRKTFEANRLYKVSINKKQKIISIDGRSIDPFEEYGIIFDSFHNFVFGEDRNNLFTQDSYKAVVANLANVENYMTLLQAQIHPYNKTPLGVAMDTFVAGCCNYMQDDPKYLLLLTSLEALFSRTAFELQFRLATNIAWFLNPKPSDYKERKVTVDLVKTLYANRSKIAHGSYVEIKPSDYDQSLLLFSKIIGKIMDEYKNWLIFLSDKKHEEFIENLEVGYFKGQTKK